jgi:hypothetical protein
MMCVSCVCVLSRILMNSSSSGSCGCIGYWHPAMLTVATVSPLHTYPVTGLQMRVSLYFAFSHARLLLLLLQARVCVQHIQQ